MANSKHPDGKAHYEPFHLDLHCLHTYLIWSAELETVNTDHTCTTIVILFFIHLFFFSLYFLILCFKFLLILFKFIKIMKG